MKLLLPPKIITRIKRELCGRRREIGGVLVGEHVAADTFRIVGISVQRVGGTDAHFVRDPEHAKAFLADFFTRIESDYLRFNYIGEWHSHPGFVPVPSVRDLDTMYDIVGDPSVGINFGVLIIVRLRFWGRLEMSATLFRPGTTPELITVEVETHADDKSGRFLIWRYLRFAEQIGRQSLSDLRQLPIHMVMSPTESSSPAKVLAARFSGQAGTRRYRDLLLRQDIVQGRHEVADQIMQVAKIESYDPGGIIFRQDGIDTDMFLILVGSVTVSPNDRDDTVRSAGTHVGEMATIDPAARRSATVRANEPTVVARITEHDFTSIGKAYPSMWRYLAWEMSNRLRQRVAKVPPRGQRPRLFIASSTEGLGLAEALGAALAGSSIDIQIWSKGIFGPGITNIEALETEFLRSDFAALVLTPDDEVISRGASSVAPRDNLIFELGLFYGALGRRRAIMVYPRGLDLKLPTDLLGVNPIRYVGTDMISVATDLAELIRTLGPR